MALDQGLQRILDFHLTPSISAEKKSGRPSKKKAARELGRNIESRVPSVNFEPLTPPPTSIIDGALDAAGKMLTLDTEGPSFTGDGSLVPYLDIIEIESDD